MDNVLRDDSDCFESEEQQSGEQTKQEPGQETNENLFDRFASR